MRPFLRFDSEELVVAQIVVALIGILVFVGLVGICFLIWFLIKWSFGL